MLHWHAQVVLVELMQRTAVAPSRLCVGNVIVDAVQLVMS